MIEKLLAAPVKPVESAKPVTAEQKAGSVSVVSTVALPEGATRIDHLPLEAQMDMVFNPLQSVTKTEGGDVPSESTFIIQPKPV